jgi:hypothetical protein
MPFDNVACQVERATTPPRHFVIADCFTIVSMLLGTRAPKRNIRNKKRFCSLRHPWRKGRVRLRKSQNLFFAHTLIVRGARMS